MFNIPIYLLLTKIIISLQIPIRNADSEIENEEFNINVLWNLALS